MPNVNSDPIILDVTLVPDWQPRLREALEDAYPNVEHFNLLLSDSLQQNLDAFSTSTSGRSVVYDQVIRSVQSSGLLSKLFAGALEGQPANEKLLVLAEEAKAAALALVIPVPCAIGGPSHYETCQLFNGRYFINRNEVRQQVKTLLEDEYAEKILAVTGPSQSGKSHCYHFLGFIAKKACFHVQLVHIELPDYCLPGSSSIDSIQLATTIVEKLELPVSGAFSEQAARFEIWFFMNLPRWIQEASWEENRVKCIVIDGFVPGLLDSGAAGLLEKLARRIDSGEFDQLRLVLLGHRLSDPNINSAKIDLKAKLDNPKEELLSYFLSVQKQMGLEPDKSLAVDKTINILRLNLNEDGPRYLFELSKAVAREVGELRKKAAAPTTTPVAAPPAAPATSPAPGSGNSEAQA